MSFQPRYKSRIITRLDLDKKVRNTSILGPNTYSSLQIPGNSGDQHVGL